MTVVGPGSHTDSPPRRPFDGLSDGLSDGTASDGTAGRVPQPRAVGDAEELLYRNARTSISRVADPRGQGHVIRKESHGPGATARLAHEAEILGRLAGVAGIPRLIGEGGVVSGALLMEDVGGEALTVLLTAGRLGGARWLEVTLDLALDVAGVVAAMHKRGVVHKDINPANIVVSDAGTPVLIDYDLATTFAEERPQFTHQSEIAGTLPYLAPEQSGRMGRPVDHRADLYALGATLYEVLTGRPPFENDDPLALIHDHLARVPIPPANVDGGIPRSVSDVVMRLLEKEPDRRYQSAEGLAYDLALLRDRQRSDTQSTLDILFVPGERDFPLRLAAPSRLVGRDAEIAALTSAFEDAIESRRRAVFVAGDPGTGKTALIDELRTVVTAAGGWYVTGKFDQHRQDLAADGVNQALGALIRLMLAEPEESLAALRERLLAALGRNAGLVAAMAPESATLLGVPPQPPAGAPAEVKARLLQAGSDFLRAVVSPSRPVVMVLDDLQWAASTPLDMIDTLLMVEDLPGLLLVGAYRTAEVDAAHLLTTRVRHWDRLGMAPDTLRLANLPPSDLGELLIEMLRLRPDQAAGLAEALSVRTGGNPFDTVELVNALRQDGVLVPRDGGWQWDPEEIRRHIGRGEVVEILCARMERLPAAGVEMLSIMACLGGEVDRRWLLTATGLPAAELDDALAPGLESGMLVSAAGGEAVRFRHDRIQEAAYRLLDGAAREPLHLRLARNLAAGLATQPQLAPTAAEQYLSAADAVLDPAERYRVAALFRDVGQRATAVNPALAERFFASATVLLAGAGIEDSDPLLVTVEDTWHQCLVSLGRFDQGDEVYRAIERRRPDPIARADAACTQIASLSNRNQPGEAVALGLDLLGHLGMPVPDPAAMAIEIQEGLEGLRDWAETDHDAEAMRPIVASPDAEATARVIGAVITPVVLSNPALMAWLVVRSWRLWVAHGPLPALAGPLAHAAFVTIGAGQDYRTGYRVARRMVAVTKARGDLMEAAQAEFLFVANAAHWFEPLEDVVAQTRAVSETLLQAGNFNLGSYASVVLLAPLLDCAPTLDATLAETESGFALARRLGHEMLHNLLIPPRQLLRSLYGQTASPGSFSDETFDEEDYFARMARPDASSVTYSAFAIGRAMSAAVFGQVDELTRCADVAAKAMAALPAVYQEATGRLMVALSLAQRVRSAEPTVRAALLAQFDGHREWYVARAVDSPATFAYLVSWLDAERAWALGDVPGTLAGFDRALRDVQHRQRPWHRALITERSALFHLEQGLEHTGRILLHGAHDCYQAWGAVAKVRLMETDHPFLRDRAARPADRAHDSHGRRHVTTGPRHSLGPQGSTLTVSSHAMDLLAVLKASQALSSETNLEQLRARVVEVLSALTGATSVRLLLRHDDTQGWYLPSGGSGDSATSLDDAAQQRLLPLSAFRYAERTCEPLLVEDAARDDRFQQDPYLAGVERCSLLVVPIMTHGLLRGMLLLENRLSGGMFTADRLDTVMLIAGQLAVSIDNALAERFRSLVQRSSDLTMVCDRAGVLSYVSAAATEVLGHAESALAGRALADLVHPDDRVEFGRRVRHPETGDGQAFEFRVLEPDGSPRWVQATFTDLLADPAVGGVVIHLRDVTERHRLENDLRHAQKLESVGQLAAGIAHEINTPIQFVGDNVQFLSDAFGDLSRALRAYEDAGAASDPGPALVAAAQLAAEIDTPYLLDEIPSAIEQTRDGVSRVAIIVRAMKAFGHPSGDSKAMSDLNEAIRSTLVVAGSELKYVADVVTDLADLPPVWCNLGDINQVVLNLVVNAAHAVGEAMRDEGDLGTITVRTRCEGEDVLIEVVDTGVGIPAEIAERVFEQFFTTKQVGTGTGQGLALAYTLVHDRHGGTISFTSEAGVGTTFTVRFPYRQPT